MGPLPQLGQWEGCAINHQVWPADAHVLTRPGPVWQSLNCVLCSLSCPDCGTCTCSSCWCVGWTPSYRRWVMQEEAGYSRLGLAKEATERDIRLAYRTLSLQLHQLKIHQQKRC
uniref:J domain-containing protein n=1 Tax=Eutreptiella gymnastica TaxID=73025 RepID=A0A7S1NJ93_9EUGL